MAKYNKVSSYSELENEPLAVEPEVSYTTNTRALVKLLYPVNVRVQGQATGELYKWTRAGQVVEVDLLDLEQVLDMKLGVGGCCGSARKANQLFQIV